MRWKMKCIPAAVLLAFLVGAPGTAVGRVTMTGMINQSTGFTMDILGTATFTVDDWLSNPNLWWITLTNEKLAPATTPEDTAAVVEARIIINISSPKYPGIIDNGTMRLIGKGGNYFRNTDIPNSILMAGGPPLIINNTMISGESKFMSGKWSATFRDEVLRIGYLPEGTYTLSFSLEGKYSTGKPIERVDTISSTIEIKNPLPPELVTPDNRADNVVTVPRFAWQEPQIPIITVKNIKKTINILYTITLWKMFNETGAVLTREEAIRRIPIWTEKNITQPSVEFKPGVAREDLVPGRKYCWQVQAFDNTGRYISSINEGKSDIWEFSVKFTPAVLNEPILFFPLRFSWTGAQAGGAVLRYEVSVAATADFSRAYTMKGLLLTSFAYPSDAPTLVPGKIYYLRIQTTDDKGIPIGGPTVSSFTIPTVEVNLLAPDDNATVPTLTPTFKWQGAAKSYVVTVFQEGTRWSVSSGKVDGTSWTYSGEELKRGTTYSWNVAPADERGEPAGPPTPARKFTLPEESQITLSSPVNVILDTIFPVFSWTGLPRSDSQVSYIIEITTESGAAVHSATVSETTFPYPKDAPLLGYGTKYLWSVRAQRNGADIGQRSGQAWFVTPFVAAGAGEPTLPEIGAAIQQVLSDNPQFAPFKDLTVTGLRDQNGPVSPTQFLEMLDKYRITSVTVK